MNRFNAIDEKLKQFAERYNAEIHTNISIVWVHDTRVPSDKLQERIILWIDGSIGKGIFITPDYSRNDIDSPLWDFENYASLEDGKSYPDGKPTWVKYLLKKVEFEEIERNIDQLLNQSAINLDAVRIADL